MMPACQSCTNSHEAGCKAGGGAGIQGRLGHPESEPGNHSGQGASAQGQDTQSGISLHGFPFVPRPRQSCRYLLVSELPVIFSLPPSPTPHS